DVPPANPHAKAKRPVDHLAIDRSQDLIETGTRWDRIESLRRIVGNLRGQDSDGGVAIHCFAPYTASSNKNGRSSPCPSVMELRFESRPYDTDGKDVQPETRERVQYVRCRYPGSIRRGAAA